MAEYIDRELLLELINENCKYEVATTYYQQGCNDVCNWAVKIIKNMPTEDVVPRSEVEELQKKLKDYERVVGKLSFTVDGVATLLIGKEVEYIEKDLANGFKNMAVKQAKQEVAKQIFEEIEKELAEEDNIFEKCASRLVGSDYCNGRSETIGFILNLIAELKKKYIGE